MTNQQHPITPPDELVRQWTEATKYKKDMPYPEGYEQYEQRLCTAAAQWGADKELEACKQFMHDQDWFMSPTLRMSQLHNARRPKPLSLKEQALHILDTPPQPMADGEVAELQRWGVNHGAQPGRPLLSPMEDGYWTPWHIAADLLQRLASDNAGLEAAAESAYLDNLSLLDSQND